MAEIDWDYWTRLDLWPVVSACQLVYGEDPNMGMQPEDIRNPDTRGRSPSVNLYHTAKSAIEAGKLRCCPGGVDPSEFVAWAQKKGVIIPEDAWPRTTIAPDHEPIARRKAPDTFIAALIRLIAEISKRAAEKGMPFNVTEMPGRKADFRALAIKFDDELDQKTPRTFDDYLAGLLRFKQGARQTPFYQDLFPEYFAPRRSDP